MRLWVKFTLFLISCLLIVIAGGYQTQNKSYKTDAKNTDLISFCDSKIVKSIIDNKSKTPYLDATLFARDQIDFKTSTIYLSNGTSVTLKEEAIQKSSWKIDNKGKITLSLGNGEKEFNGILFIQPIKLMWIFQSIFLMRTY